MRRGARLDVTRAARVWSPPVAQLTAWTCAALGRRAHGAELALRVVGTAESRRLNAQFRGRDAPTNVLSFPAPRLPAARARGSRPLGDLVICARLLRAEARAQGKTLRAHWAHLVVHGALHLIGYDHRRARDARRMERREIAVLRGLGFANPYRSA
jgi:probable rRNA maturation factor